MFIDKNSKKLIEYLAVHEPYKLEKSKLIYTTSELVSAIGKQNSINNAETIFPYLEKLKNDGYIIDYHFIGNASVTITRAVQLEFWKSYRRHLFLHDIAIPAIVSLIVALSAALFTQAIQLSNKEEPKPEIQQECNQNAN